MRMRALDAACMLFLTAIAAVGADKPLSLHPDNPHYFLFRGKPTVLVTSGEHYGAVLNAGFDYIPYLDELKNRQFNLTRTFSGTYREDPAAFGIVDNTLAPKRFLSPWGATAPSSTSNATTTPISLASRTLSAQAGKRGIVVELSLFCAVYNDKLWDINPMKTANNVNGVGNSGRLDAYTGKDKELTKLQELLVRKIVGDLKDYDNVYYEICNEPYFGGVTKQWNDRMVAVIANAEKALPFRHLIAQNIGNGSSALCDPNPNISVLNFHYCSPPDAVTMNFGLKRAVGFDETGFRGAADRPYRTDAWDFLMAGGAVYSNLDYSYSVAHPDGTAKVTTSPGGGGPVLRQQLAVLKQFMDGLDFVHMKPDNGVIKDGTITSHLVGQAASAKETMATVRALAEHGKTYALYIKGGVRAELSLELPRGRYKAEWVNTKTGSVEKAENFDHDGRARKLISPAYDEETALRIRRGAK